MAASRSRLGAALTLSALFLASLLGTAIAQIAPVSAAGSKPSVNFLVGVGGEKHGCTNDRTGDCVAACAGSFNNASVWVQFKPIDNVVVPLFRADIIIDLDPGLYVAADPDVRIEGKKMSYRKETSGGRARYVVPASFGSPEGGAGVYGAVVIFHELYNNISTDPTGNHIRVSVVPDNSVEVSTPGNSMADIVFGSVPGDPSCPVQNVIRQTGAFYAGNVFHTNVLFQSPGHSVATVTIKTNDCLKTDKSALHVRYSSNAFESSPSCTVDGDTITCANIKLYDFKLDGGYHTNFGGGYFSFDQSIVPTSACTNRVGPMLDGANAIIVTYPEDGLTLTSDPNGLLQGQTESVPVASSPIQQTIASKSAASMSVAPVPVAGKKSTVSTASVTAAEKAAAKAAAKEKKAAVNALKKTQKQVKSADSRLASLQKKLQKKQDKLATGSVTKESAKAKLQTEISDLQAQIAALNSQKMILQTQKTQQQADVNAQ